MLVTCRGMFLGSFFLLSLQCSRIINTPRPVLAVRDVWLYVEIHRRGVDFGSSPYRLFMDKQKYPNSVIYQHIERAYLPAASWEACDQAVTDEEIYQAFSHLVEDMAHLEELLRILDFKREFNEHNRKYYWLVKVVV